MIRWQHACKNLILVVSLTLLLIQILKYNGNNSIRKKYKADYNMRVRAPYNVRETNDRSNERKIVLIVGQGRTGSTLLGDLFNNMDDFIYFFEPLRYARHLNEINATDWVPNNRETFLYMQYSLSCTT